MGYAARPDPLVAARTTLAEIHGTIGAMRNSVVWFWLILIGTLTLALFVWFLTAFDRLPPLLQIFGCILMVLMIVGYLRDEEKRNWKGSSRSHSDDWVTGLIM